MHANGLSQTPPDGSDHPRSDRTHQAGFLLPGMSVLGQGGDTTTTNGRQTRGNHDMIFRPNARAHSPFRAIEVGATNPEASETRHRATSTTNALKAMVKEVEFRREERREGSVNRWISEWIKLNIAGGSKLVPRIPPT